MKKFIIFFIVFVLLTGCVSVKTEIPSASPSPEPKPTARVLDFKYEVIDFESLTEEVWEGKYDTRCIVVTSRETLDTLKELVIDNCYEYKYVKRGVEFIDTYTESMFEEYGLVILALYQTYGALAPDYIIESVTADDETVEVELIRKTAGKDMCDAVGEWVIFVELYDFEYTGQELVINRTAA